MKKTEKNQKIAGISSEAVKAKTKKNWAEWFAILDKAGARKMNHTQIAAYLYEKENCSGWWSQMVAVGYEQAHRMRQKHQTPRGWYEISRSKTIGASTQTLYNA